MHRIFLLFTCFLTYLFTYLLTHSIQHSSSCEANRFSASLDIPRILWNPNVYNCIHKCTQPVPILSQINSFHNVSSHFLKIHHNIILPSAPGSPKWPFSVIVPPQSLYTPLPSPIHTTCLAHRILLDVITRKIFGEQYRSLSSTDHKAVQITKQYRSLNNTDH